MSLALMMLVAMALDVVLGWPDALYQRIGHPVTWLGALIDRLDRQLNRPDRSARQRQIAGGVTVGLVCLAAGLPALLVQILLPGGVVGIVLGGVLAWPLVAVRSMYTHVRDVARPLRQGDLAGARRAVSMIVGRDPTQLGPAGVARAALESLAENTSDGIVAPLFWGAVAGLPGIALYKAINTMDSMIGHRTPRHEDFGKAAARLDDLVNLPASRLSGALFALASGRPRRGWQVIRRDAGLHRSPNAGWPEGAMAGALGVRLSGPRRYGEVVVDEPWMNAGAPDPAPQDLDRGLALYRRAMILCAALLALVGVM